ncbi:DUF1639 domain-containing protein [Cephalotus follicularis]|uniref:DUF1639 domain-containing protein n=1 Tax=Cephalotus follicularis TaxID=3775 RepID=A0A1Q3BW87_CEPFO|nr:DUF1639 domain-containing protein [Cephalotus follicularis]
MASTFSLKSHPLHNFPLPHLQWGNTNRHRKHKESPPQDSSFSLINGPDHPDAKNPTPSSSSPDGSKTSLLLRLRTKAKIVDVASDAAADQALIAANDEELESKTWNLRPRKEIVKKAVANAIGSAGASRTRASSPQVIKTQSKDVVEEKGAAAAKEEKENRRRLSIWLTKEEIKEDFLLLTGSKPRKRPRKRPKHVQRQHDCLFPGLWLDSITPNSYKI